MSWHEILAPHGWEFVGTANWQGGVYEKVRHPAATHAHSATIGYGGDWLHVFSDRTPFEQGRSYTKFGAYAVLNCGGDYSEPARRLRGLGFGEPSPNGQPASKTAPRGNTRKRKAVLECISSIEEKPLEWLCHGRIPRGTLTMLAGDQKLGKSLTLVYHAACASRGRPMHGEQTALPPGSVILLSAEDPVAQVLRPRLRAAEADLDKVHIIRSVMEPGGTDVWPCLKTDIEAIEDAVCELGDVLLIGVDPVTAYLGGVDDYRGTELRNVLIPLAKMAERMNVAVELVHHVGKVPVANAKHRALGSVAYGGVCRANYLVAKDPDDPGRILLLDNGGNLGAPASTLAYKIESTLDGLPVVSWYADPVNKTAADVVAAEIRAMRSAGHAESARGAARAWLLQRLKAGSVHVNDLRAEAEAHGISWRTVQNAKKDLNVIAIKTGFAEGDPWTWDLGSP
jgi:hypothetical protein